MISITATAPFSSDFSTDFGGYRISITPRTGVIFSRIIITPSIGVIFRPKLGGVPYDDDEELVLVMLVGA